MLCVVQCALPAVRLWAGPLAAYWCWGGRTGWCWSKGETTCSPTSWSLLLLCFDVPVEIKSLQNQVRLIWSAFCCCAVNPQTCPTLKGQRSPLKSRSHPVWGVTLLVQMFWGLWCWPMSMKVHLAPRQRGCGLCPSVGPAELSPPCFQGTRQVSFIDNQNNTNISAGGNTNRTQLWTSKKDGTLLFHWPVSISWICSPSPSLVCTTGGWILQTSSEWRCW